MKRTIMVLVLCLVLLMGCSGPSLPPVEEVPYVVIWEKAVGGTGRVYCDNYELGSSVIIDGYWEFRTIIISPGYFYNDGLLILDAGAVRIEKRETSE